MKGREEGGSMLAGMTTPTIVPVLPDRQLSGSIIPGKLVRIGTLQVDFARFFGTVPSSGKRKTSTPFEPNSYDFLT